MVERHVKASPETVFRFFTDPRRWLQWQGVDAVLEARPGGRFRMDVTGDGWASGQFVEVVPPRRIVLTWGWEVEGSPVAPRSSTVGVELEPAQVGWANYLDRLMVRAAGRPIGTKRSVNVRLPCLLTTVGARGSRSSHATSAPCAVV